MRASYSTLEAVCITAGFLQRDQRDYCIMLTLLMLEGEPRGLRLLFMATYGMTTSEVLDMVRGTP